MSTLEERREIATAGVHDSRNGVATRVVLQPIAAPSILGLAGFAGATFIVASNLAGWWGTPQSPLALAPFAAMFGGLRSSWPACGPTRRGTRSRPSRTGPGGRSGSPT